jgi:CubicO group peptidase (beta-lactamase class C family)
MNKVIVVSLIAVLLCSANCYAQSNAAASEKDFASAFDAYIQKTMERLPVIPGLAVVVIKDDHPVFVRAYGMADKEAGTKAAVDTLFYIASSTKSFTALSAALLDKEGKIKLDDSISKYSSGIQFKDQLPDKITVRDLLTHTSGLRNEALTFRMAYSGESDPADMKRVFADGTTFVDGRYGKYNYDNLGYNIYAVLLQNHLGMKWQDLLQDKIFDPVGMKHTTAYVSKARAKKWKIAAPYLFDAATGKMERSPLSKTDSNMQSAGGIFASITDIGKWLNMNMNDGKLNGKQVIPADVVRAVHTGYTQTVREAPPFSGAGQYGLGWQIGKYRDEKVIYHHGGFPGYRSHISFLPEKRIAVAVLANDGFAGARAADVLATYAYDWWLGTADLKQVYEKQLQDLVDGYTQGTKRIIASTADRAKRTSQLTQPLADYAGTYRNDIYGTIEISVSGNDLAVRMGNISCIATPFTEKETIRVEMIPGSGEVIKFNKNAEKGIESLAYAGVPFAKVSR